MSIALIESEIHRFLSTGEPEVICISGHWGVGKTFAWNRYLKEAKPKIALKRYSYVSLFGVNSLDEFKYSIFENSVQSSDVDIEPSLEAMQSNTTAVANRLSRKSLWFLQQIPLIKNYVGGLGPVWFLSVKETIVCVDDIERHGENLSVRDILGLVSSLKEHKKCKVALILNDEALEEVKDKREFETYLEKVVDTFLKFAPSAEESARIALTEGTATNNLLAESCIALGISNIRLIKKIERVVRRIEPLLKQFDERVMKQAVQSLTLFGWSLHEPLTAPPHDYLKRRVSDFFAPNKKELPSEKEAAWSALLDDYGFTGMDEFDLVLLDGIRDGFFDPCLIEKHASALDERVRAARSDSSWEDAWREYHDSFADNQQQVLDTIYQSFLKDVQRRTHLDLNGTVTLLKELGRPEQAAEIIAYYVESRGKDRKSFDLDSYPFRDRIDDADVIRAFKANYAKFEDERDPTAVVLSVANKHGWSEEDIGTLSTLRIDEYYTIFKRHTGQELRKIIDACLQFDRFESASEPMREISKRAREALKRIGKESRINARRVRKYGVEVDVVSDGDAS